MEMFPLALDAANRRLELKRRGEFVGDPDLRRFVAREIRWQNDWCTEHNQPFVAALYVAAGESAVDFFLKTQPVEDAS